MLIIALADAVARFISLINPTQSVEADPPKILPFSKFF